MPYGQPNYSSYNIPSSGGLYDFLGSGDQSRMNMSSSQLAESFGYSGSDYGDAFTPFNTSDINKSMSELPELQKFLQGNVREGFNANKQGLLGKVGRTGMSGTGSFNKDFQSLNSQFGQQMFGADKQIQDIVSQLKGQVAEGAGSWRNSLMGLIQSGADKIGDSSDSGGTVLCTELHRQGIMSNEIYEKDAAFGKTLSSDIINGYQLWAKPLVKVMQKSKLVTKLLTKPIMAWANHIAGNRNLFGTIAMSVGIPACKMINKISRLFTRSNYGTIYKSA